MAIKASIALQDTHGRIVRKSVECEATTLAQAITDVNALLATLSPITDLAAVGVTYSSKDVTGNFAGAGSSNVDVGATFQGRLESGKKVAVKVPGILDSLADTNGSIDITDEDVAAFLANFLTAGAFRVSDGEIVDEWIKGTLDR